LEENKMKYISLFLLLIFLASELFSQDFEPSQRQFNVNGSDVYISDTMEVFRQDDFIIGWHWGGPRKITEAVRGNQSDMGSGFYADPDSTVNNCYLVLKPDGYSHADGAALYNARAIVFEPTLKIDPFDPSKLVKKPGDNSFPVFGFRAIGADLQQASDSNDVNYSRLLLDTSIQSGTVVLEKPWPDNEFYMHGRDRHSDTATHTINSFLGRQIYFSINVRRPDIEMSDDVLLKIELPYVLGNNSSDYIVFDQIPMPAPTDTFHLVNGRGILREFEKAPPFTSVFYITKNMIPPNSEDITISAFFEVDGNINEHLKIGENANDDEIDSLRIKITYMGNGPVYIDWCKFETPHAREFLWGTFDDQIANNVQSYLTEYAKTKYTSIGAKPFRFNLIVEGFPFNWIAERYFNRLVGPINTNEVVIRYPDHYDYYVNAPDKWYAFWNPPGHIAAPYTTYSYNYSYSNRVKTLGAVNGFTGFHNGSFSTDLSVAHYETYLCDTSASVDIGYFLDNPDSLDLYHDVINYGANYWKLSLQANFEQNIYESFFHEKSGNMPYSNKFWWGQIFSHFQIDTVIYWEFDHPDPGEDSTLTKSIWSSLRTMTGEEYSLATYIPLIFGAKGLIYDGPGKFTDITDAPGKTYFYDGIFIDAAEKAMIEDPSYPTYDFLNTKIGGSDYFELSNEIYGYDTLLFNHSIIEQYTGRPIDKQYFGRRTQRLAMRWVHDWVRAVEDTLMNLRMQAAYSKGYRILLPNHRTDFSYS
jgi:hypothetical protein